MTLRTPGGKPARLASRASDSAVKGVSGDGLTTMQQPAARAALAFRSIKAMGKFLSSKSAAGSGLKQEGVGREAAYQGTSAATTPMGCLMTMDRRPAMAFVTVEPWIRSASPMNHHTKRRA